MISIKVTYRQIHPFQIVDTGILILYRLPKITEQIQTGHTKGHHGARKKLIVKF